MRRYTTLDLLRFHKFVMKNPGLRGIELIRGYNKEIPELSEEERLHNLKVALGLNCSIRLNSNNPNHYVTMCRGYARLEYMGKCINVSDHSIKQWFTLDSTEYACNEGHSYKDHVNSFMKKRVL